jgi:probable F420-dependent oxidoreductase
MHIGLFGFHRGGSVDAKILTQRGRRAEELGFESLWVGDHIALPVTEQAADNAAYEPRLEALTTLTYLAAVTSQVKLAVGVIVLPQRQPVLLAKQLASLDVLSNGRLIVGFGVGYVDLELKALGANLNERGARTDEYLAAMRALWDEPIPSFHGQFVDVQGVVQRPRPIQRPHPPIIFGGRAQPAYKRTLEFAQGWYGFDMDPDDTAQALDELNRAAERYPRPTQLGELEITITPKGVPDLETARRFADLGVHRLAVQPPTMAGAALDELMTQLADTLLGRV